MGRYLQFEEAEDLLLAQTNGAWRAGLGEELVEQLAFLFQHFMDALLDCISGHHARNCHGRGNTDAMRAIDGLIFNGWIPPAIKQKRRNGKTAELSPTLPAP